MYCKYCGKKLEGDFNVCSDCSTKKKEPEAKVDVNQALGSASDLTVAALEKTGEAVSEGAKVAAAKTSEVAKAVSSVASSKTKEFVDDLKSNDSHKKNKAIGALVVALVVVIALCTLLFRPKTIDFTDYVILECRGDNEYGRVYFNIDEDGFRDELVKKVKMSDKVKRKMRKDIGCEVEADDEYVMAGILCEAFGVRNVDDVDEVIEKLTNLVADIDGVAQNGDKVVFELDLPGDTSKDFGVRLVASKKVFRVTGLE